MRVLVACEESQVVTKAFRARGHEAYSADIIECSGGRPEWHIQGDVLEILDDGWDMMIGFPPCTYLAKCGLHYLKTKPERKAQLEYAFEFFMKLYSAPIYRVSLENPAGWLNTNWKRPSQIIQPYYFGDMELKETCLWLKNLPNLWYWKEDDLFGKKTATEKPEPKSYTIRKSGPRKGERYNYHFRAGKSAKERSKTFPGIANAMAAQWG